MSQADPEAINLEAVPANGEEIDPGHGGSDYPPQPWQGQPSQGPSSAVDGSEPLFSMYVDMTAEYDNKMAKSWKGDADGILVFTGLFSAAVAALASVSVQDLRPNSQDISAFYTAHIYQLLANANGSYVPIPSTIPDPSAPFSPPTYAIWVNSLWFLSLTMSLTCALLATLLQQWARRYVRITQPRFSSHKRARIRAFFSEGVDKLHLPWAVEALPTLLHLSLFLFFAGLLIFLFNVHQTVFSAVTWWIGLCVAIYACITFMPIFRHDSPYYAPLSSSAWCLVSGTLFLLFRTLFYSPFLHYSSLIRFGDLMDQFRKWFLQGLEKITQETARIPSSEIDRRVLTWTFDSLDEDHELERFFSSIPGFCSSTVVADPLGTFIRPNETKLLWALIGLMDRTSASSLVPNAIKQRRSAICVRAMDAASLPLNKRILYRIFSEEWNGFLSSIELGQFLRRVDHSDPSAALYSQCAISIIISRDRERDNRWFELTAGHLGVSGPVLRNYLAHGDSLRPTPGSRSKTFEWVTKFDIHRTLPGLQHDFCHHWNDIVHKAHNPETDNMEQLYILQLRHLRNAYISLHQDTNAAPTAFSADTDIDDHVLDNPSSYPSCTIQSHRHTSPTNSTPNIPEVTATAREDAAAVPAGVFVGLPHHALVTADSSSTRPDPPLPPSLDAPTASGTFSASVPVGPLPAPYLISPESDPATTSFDPASIHGVVAGIAESTTNTSVILSAANIVPPSTVSGAPPSPTPTPINAPPTDLKSDFPTLTLSTTSTTVFPLIIPQTISISEDPRVVSDVATPDAHQDVHDLTLATRHPHPDKASPPSLSDIAMDALPSFSDTGPLVQDTGGLGTVADSSQRPA
ncbi:hypothetical protein BJV74DRAFT_54068 [Russula compacta]|nr:hypothetical protein BJV74DRAFT_54068 [Russula compacta]